MEDSDFEKMIINRVLNLRDRYAQTQSVIQRNVDRLAELTDELERMREKVPWAFDANGEPHNYTSKERGEQ